ncbi:hypothetical protein [Mesorhizobium sp. M9A.F.Ca.ET.002.03.1.2]|uniref:hypothetical protein n=1 Tax=Mesorhizobium sp. M9A.F.Ca.ET.002.03.1.2 TaxID=2493668 RepID=UPI001FDF32EC|nr:hypothetical protein [Mesorhizobium sp. M9A.F.Ca.ET.002.03.1.2]
METLLCGVALLAVIAMPAAAETAYDRNLEKAVMDIVAGKIGEIRGSFFLRADAAAGRSSGGRAGAARCHRASSQGSLRQ